MIDNFVIEESPNGYFMIYNKYESDHFIKIKGSATVIEARLFNLPFADYCRMCRDIYGAKLYGKAPYFIIAFDTKDEAKELLKDLNRRWRVVEKTLEGLSKV